MSAGCECMSGKRGSGVVSSAYNMIEMSVVTGVVCEMCMCLARRGG